MKGHLKPFGQQGAGSLRSVEIVEGFMKPKDFMKNHVHQNKPLIMRGAAKVSPAWKKWTDQYLSEKVSYTYHNVKCVSQ